MKYIRTETFITELESWKKVYRKTLIMNNIAYDIVKSADTIEELCDEIVVCFDSNVRPVMINHSIFWAKHYAGKTGHIMGAIWTDKGLIYVAKMNDKGELELL